MLGIIRRLINGGKHGIISIGIEAGVNILGVNLAYQK